MVAIELVELKTNIDIADPEIPVMYYCSFIPRKSKGGVIV